MAPEQVYQELREYALAKDGAGEDYPWGDVAWKVKGKMFACTAENHNSVTVKSTLEKQASLVMHPSIEAAHYVGRFGWVTVTIQDRDTLDLAKDLIDDSYELVTAKGRKVKPRRLD